MSKFTPDAGTAFSLAVSSLVLAGCSMMQQSPEPARAVLPTAQNYPSPVIVHTPAPLPAAAPASAASAASAAFDPVKPAARPPATRLRRSGGPAPAAATPVAPRPVPRMICEDKTGKEIPCPR